MKRASPTHGGRWLAQINYDASMTHHTTENSWVPDAGNGSDNGWSRPGDKPLSEPMMVSLLTLIWVTWPQWVKARYGGSVDDLVSKNRIWVDTVGMLFTHQCCYLNWIKVSNRPLDVFIFQFVDKCPWVEHEICAVILKKHTKTHLIPTIVAPMPIHKLVHKAHQSNADLM